MSKFKALTLLLLFFHLAPAPAMVLGEIHSFEDAEKFIEQIFARSDNKQVDAINKTLSDDSLDTYDPSDLMQATVNLFIKKNGSNFSQESFITAITQDPAFKDAINVLNKQLNGSNSDNINTYYIAHAFDLGIQKNKPSQKTGAAQNKPHQEQKGTPPKPTKSKGSEKDTAKPFDPADDDAYTPLITLLSGLRGKTDPTSKTLTFLKEAIKTLLIQKKEFDRTQVDIEKRYANCNAQDAIYPQYLNELSALETQRLDLRQRTNKFEQMVNNFIDEEKDNIERADHVITEYINWLKTFEATTDITRKSLQEKITIWESIKKEQGEINKIEDQIDYDVTLTVEELQQKSAVLTKKCKDLNERRNNEARALQTWKIFASPNLQKTPEALRVEKEALDAQKAREEQEKIKEQEQIKLIKEKLDREAIARKANKIAEEAEQYKKLNFFDRAMHHLSKLMETEAGQKLVISVSVLVVGLAIGCYDYLNKQAKDSADNEDEEDDEEDDRTTRSKKSDNKRKAARAKRKN